MTKSDLCNIIAVETHASFGVEESPQRPREITRGFFGRIWAAIRHKSTFEIVPCLASVRIVFVCNKDEIDLVSMSDFLDEYKPAGILIFLERIDPSTTKDPGAYT